MATQQQLAQLEEQLNVLESQGSIFFDKISNSLITPITLDEAKKNRDTLMQTINGLEALLQQSSASYLSEQNPEDSLQKLRESSEQQSNNLHREKERILKNIDKARTVVSKQQLQQQ